MLYLHPLAYLLGLEGHALMRAFAGDFADQAFVEARFAEIRQLLDDANLIGTGAEVDVVGSPEGYAIWSRSYDQPGNGAFPLEEPFVLRILDALPVGRVLDAACGTGRYARHLARRGHDVVAVDSSAEMLAVARAATPGADFVVGALESLPLEDSSVDAVVCALALTHVCDLAPVMAEFARVLRPGGHLVISNMHACATLFGSIPRLVAADGRPARIASYRHETGDYFRAATGAGLRALACEEPQLPLPHDMPPPRSAVSPLIVGDWRDWPWNLDDIAPQAAWAAQLDRPVTVIWHFQRP
jgi:SAM-dependent methyltransferase